MFIACLQIECAYGVSNWAKIINLNGETKLGKQCLANIGITVLQSRATNGFWGNWEKVSTCPDGHFVYGYRLRSEEQQNRGDDTALNDIELRCADKNLQEDYTSIYSSYSSRGTFSPLTYCHGSDNPVIGFRMRMEARVRGGDNTAANDVDLYCKKGGHISAEVNTNWGDLTQALRCPSGQAVMGIATRVEPNQGEGDDTALNGVVLFCKNYYVSWGWKQHASNNK